MQEDKKAVVIILTYNGEKYIKACLSSLQNQTYQNYSLQVVDNNSSDRTLEIVKKDFPQVNLMENKKNLGFARGNNLAIKKALKKQAQYLVLLNQDTKVEPNFLEEGIKVLSSPKVGLASPTILYANSDKIWWAGSKIYRGKEILKFHTTKIGEHKNKGKKYTKPTNDISETDWLPACALFIKKGVIDKIGLLDETFFMYGEDLDFSLRAKKNNFKLLYFPGTTVYHDTRDYLKQKFSGNLIKKGFWKTRARLKIVWRYFNLKEKIFYLTKCLTLPFFYVSRK